MTKEMAKKSLESRYRHLNAWRKHYVTATRKNYSDCLIKEIIEEIESYKRSIEQLQKIAL